MLEATRENILNGLNEMREKLKPGDSLLVYYAGHGEYKKEADKAYWLPVDAHQDKTTNWIIADDITSNLKYMNSKHILIVSDSCYSGTLTRTAATELKTANDRDAFMKKMQERPSRTLMASGGNEPVADGGGGGHSVFAAAFIKALNEAERTSFTAEEVFHGRIKEIVGGKSDQVPEYNNIKNSGHEGGDFVFQLMAGKIEWTEEPAPRAEAKKEKERPQKQEEKAEADSTEKGILALLSVPDSGRVIINGSQMGETPVELKLTPGTYEVEITKKGYHSSKEKIMVRGGARTNLNLELTKNTASIKLSGDLAGAKVYLDGAYAGEGVESFTSIADGSHTIDIKKEGYKPFKRTMEIKGGQVVTVTIALKTLNSQTAAYKDSVTGIELVFVDGGCYLMGDTFGDGGANEKPVHEVCVDDFYIGKYEVTQGQWQAVMGSNPSFFKGCGTNCPVEQVSWDDAQEFISKLNSRSESNKYRLPTEAEWEYAARSRGKSEKYSGSNDIGSVA